MATVDFTEEAATGENAPDDHGWGCRHRGCRADYGGPHGGTDEGKGNLRHPARRLAVPGMEDLIRLVDETELNAMVIDVKNDEGNLTFRLI